MKCPECKSENLSWEPSVRNNGGCVDGRIRLNEVEGIFILGCNNCSETVRVISSAQFLAEHERSTSE